MKPTRSLESYREQYERTPHPATKAKIRQRARVLAAELGQDPPVWAQQARPAKASEPAPPPVPIEPAEPIAISPALSTWRAAGPGRVVNVKRDGTVRLVVLGFGGAHQEAAFTDARTAERALLLGVTWRPVAKKAG
jgi:hypothetical protein